jgi:hypothetical protein
LIRCYVDVPGRQGVIEMRVLVALLIALSLAYVWDAEYNNSRLADGVVSMGRSITHNMGRR